MLELVYKVYTSIWCVKRFDKIWTSDENT